MKELANYTIKGVYLTYDEDGSQKVIRIPQGLIQRSSDAVFFKENNRILAQLDGETSQVYPSQEWTISASGTIFTVRLARTIKELNAGKKLLLDHYMGIPSRGLFINVYHEASKDPIACGCLDRLYYAMPVGRRDILNIAKREDLLKTVFPKEANKVDVNQGSDTERIPDNLDNKAPSKKKGLRAQVVNELRIVWLSRIAIIENKEFRNIRLSVKMAELMGKIAHECMLPHADYIEVFMSCPENDAQKRKEHNLYLYAGYHLSDVKIKSSKMVFLDHVDDGYIRSAKLYFFKDLRDK